MAFLWSKNHCYNTNIALKKGRGRHVDTSKNHKNQIQILKIGITNEEPAKMMAQ